MSRRWGLIALAPLCLIVACSQPSGSGAASGSHAASQSAAADIAEAKQHMQSSMRDPESVRFSGLRSVHLSDAQGSSTIDAVCGSINSKNGMGGYSGFQPFAYVTHVHDLHPDGGAHFDAGYEMYNDANAVGPIIQWTENDIEHLCGSQTRYDTEANLMETTLTQEQAGKRAINP